jgi:hypothetical protein
VSLEERVRAATRAAAGTVEQIPDPAWPGTAPAARRLLAMPRRGRPWLAPVAAAAAVVALATALVTVKVLPNGGVASPSPAAVTPIPGVPEYYAAISLLPKYGYRQGLIVGDTFTGKLIAVPPPARTSLDIVTGAGDDRTFVAMGESTVHPAAAATWWKLTLAPGTARPARLTRLPVEQPGSLAAMALSASGRQFALVTLNAAHTQRYLGVYSTATGRLLRSWSTTSRLAFSNEFSVEASMAAFTWTNGDRAITFPALRAVSQPHSGKTTYIQEIRTLDLTAKGSDLMAHSHVIWSTSSRPAPQAKNAVTPVQSANPGGEQGPMPCGGEPYPMVSANGKTATCAANPGYGLGGPRQMTWQTYALPDLLADISGGTDAYQSTVALPAGYAIDLETLWVSSSGSAVLGEWTESAPDHSSLVGTRNSPPPPQIHFGLISHGTFTPLPTPTGVFPVTPGLVAW